VCRVPTLIATWNISSGPDSLNKSSASISGTSAGVGYAATRIGSFVK